MAEQGFRRRAFFCLFEKRNWRTSHNVDTNQVITGSCSVVFALKFWHWRFSVLSHDNPIADRIPHQVRGRMAVRPSADVASVSFCGFKGDAGSVPIPVENLKAYSPEKT